jgi:predicted Zn-dependent protease
VAQEWIQNLGLPEERMIVNRDPFLRSLDGIVYGNNPREGFSEGTRFYHPDLRFQIDFPAGWRVDNTRTAVIAMDPQQAAQLQLSVANVPDGTTPTDYARALAARGMVPQSGRELAINGYPAFLATYLMRTQDGGTIAALAAFIQYRERIFEIIGLTSDLRRFGTAIDESIRSFDGLTDSRILRAQPDRLQIYAAREGDTLTSIAERTNNPRVGADELAVLNRIAAGQPITPGRLVKIVERGY